MVCEHPITLTSPHGADFLVPCGKCLCCRAAKAKEWVQRLKNEQAYWDREGFLTLTYDDDNIPEGGKLDKPELIRFFKRLRKNLKGKKIKYFACGEYGEKTMRPHYHAIIFGLDSRDEDVIKKSWTLGEMVQIVPVLNGGIEYVTGYVRKKIDIKYSIYRQFDLPLPFQLQSKGLGLQWAIDNHDILEDVGLMSQGNNKSIPRYYIKKLDLSSEKMYKELEETLNKRDEKLLADGFTYEDIVNILIKNRLQNGINLKHKNELLSK